MIRIGICDDDPMICSKLERIVLEFQKRTAEKLSVDSFYSGQELAYQLKNGAGFDLIFLDIELGAINGVEVGHVIRDELGDYITKIVYISSKHGYDRQLFDVHPLHFLAKPLEPDKVFKDISLTLTMLNMEENNCFSFKIGHETHRIPISEILYVESVGRELKLFGAKNSFQFYGAIDAIAKSFAGLRFMRPHRAYLINYDHATSIRADAITMSNGERIPLSRLKRKEIRALQIAFEEETPC